MTMICPDQEAAEEAVDIVQLKAAVSALEVRVETLETLVKAMNYAIARIGNVLGNTQA